MGGDTPGKLLPQSSPSSALDAGGSSVKIEDPQWLAAKQCRDSLSVADKKIQQEISIMRDILKKLKQGKIAEDLHKSISQTITKLQELQTEVDKIWSTVAALTESDNNDVIENARGAAGKVLQDVDAVLHASGINKKGKLQLSTLKIV